MQKWRDLLRDDECITFRPMAETRFAATTACRQQQRATTNDDHLLPTPALHSPPPHLSPLTPAPWPSLASTSRPACAPSPRVSPPPGSRSTPPRPPTTASTTTLLVPAPTPPPSLPRASRTASRPSAPRVCRGEQLDSMSERSSVQAGAGRRRRRRRRRKRQADLGTRRQIAHRTFDLCRVLPVRVRFGSRHDVDGRCRGQRCTPSCHLLSFRLRSSPATPSCSVFHAPVSAQSPTNTPHSPPHRRLHRPPHAHLDQGSCRQALDWCPRLLGLQDVKRGRQQERPVLHGRRSWCPCRLGRQVDRCRHSFQHGRFG